MSHTFLIQGPRRAQPPLITARTQCPILNSIDPHPGERGRFLLWETSAILFTAPLWPSHASASTKSMYISIHILPHSCLNRFSSLRNLENLQITSSDQMYGLIIIACTNIRLNAVLLLPIKSGCETESSRSTLLSAEVVLLCPATFQSVLSHSSGQCWCWFSCWCCPVLSVNHQTFIRPVLVLIVLAVLLLVSVVVLVLPCPLTFQSIPGHSTGCMLAPSGLDRFPASLTSSSKWVGETDYIRTILAAVLDGSFVTMQQFFSLNIPES